MLYSAKAKIRLHIDADNLSTPVAGQPPRSIITATYNAADHKDQRETNDIRFDWSQKSAGQQYQRVKTVDEDYLSGIDDWKITNSPRVFRVLCCSMIMRKGQAYDVSSYLFIFEHVIETIEAEALKNGPVKLNTHLRVFGNLILDEEL